MSYIDDVYKQAAQDNANRHSMDIEWAISYIVDLLKYEVEKSAKSPERYPRSINGYIVSSYDTGDYISDEKYACFDNGRFSTSELNSICNEVTKQAYALGFKNINITHEKAPDRWSTSKQNFFGKTVYEKYGVTIHIKAKW